MPDLGHRLTDEELAKLEKKIAKTYKDAYNDLQGKVKAYFEQFEKRDNAMKSKLQSGEITEDYYRQWRLAQMGRGERFEALRDEVAERMTKANQVAMTYINDTTPGIYALNRNFEAYTIEQVADNVSFTAINEQAVKRLIAEDPNLLPKRRINAPIDRKWNRARFSAEITSGILQGESIKKLADRVQPLSDANRAGAIRNARTAVTGAQNAGRQATFDAAVNMGIELEKEWVSTLDGRTRHSHRMLDGEVVDYDKKFSNGLRYPGDPNGRANEVWNCRCAMVARVKGVDTSDAQRRARDSETGESVLVENMSYSEWVGWKEKAQAQNAMAKSEYNAETIDHQYAETEAMNEYDYFSAEQEKFRLDSIKKMAGYDNAEAMKALDALCGTSAEYRGIGDNVPTGWFSGADTKIRLATDGEFFDKAQTIDAYIERSPKYKGSIYRGLSLDDETIFSFSVGGTFKENGNLSSWTSDRSVASMFAEGRSEELGKKPVIFRTKDPKHGTPASHLSIFGSEESEVLVSNMTDSEYIIEAVTEEDGMVVVDMILKGV